MQPRRSIKTLLSTTRHYTPATANGRALVQPSCLLFFPFLFFSFFFLLQTTFLLLTGFTLVAVVMEECHISL